jgi:hypothetical protein
MICKAITLKKKPCKHEALLGGYCITHAKIHVFKDNTDRRARLCK